MPGLNIAMRAERNIDVTQAAVRAGNMRQPCARVMGWRVELNGAYAIGGGELGSIQAACGSANVRLDNPSNWPSPYQRILFQSQLTSNSGGEAVLGAHAGWALAGALLLSR